MAKVLKTRNANTQTERAFIGWLVSLLRKGSLRWRPIGNARKEARAGRLVNPETGRSNHAGHCASCGKLVIEKYLDVDHLTPAVKLGYTLNICSRPDFDPTKHQCIGELCDRLYVEADQLQVLCKECHSFKTAEERKLR